MRKFVIALAVALMAGASAAHAATCATPSSGVNICYSQTYTLTLVSGGSYAPTVSPILASPYHDTSGTNYTGAMNFISANPNSGSGTVVYDFDVTFNVTDSAGHTGTAKATAIYTANFSDGEDTLDWSITGDGDTNSNCSGTLGTVGASQQAPTNQCTIGVTLVGNTGIDIDLFSAYDWTMVPTIGFQQVSGLTTGSGSIPEPGSLALLGAALAGFGLLRRRRARG